MNNIRLSIIKDKNEIGFLAGKSSFGYTYDKNIIESLKQRFALKDSQYLIANKDGTPVAFCAMDRDWWEEHFFFIREIFVDQNFRKLGIGKILLEKSINHAKDKGAAGIVTETAFENIPMRKLCEKLGFGKWDNPQWKTGITYKLLF